MKKSKIIAIIGVVVLSGLCYYASKNWSMIYWKFSSIQPKNTALSQCKFNISEIDVGTKHPVWSVKTKNPTIAYVITFKNEGARNFKDSPFILDIMQDTLFDGAGERDSSDLKQFIVDNNISISASFGLDEGHLYVYTTSENFELSIDIASDILTKAHLRQDKLDVNKEKAVKDIKQSKFEAPYLASVVLDQEKFDKSHPYYVDYDEALKKIPSYTKADFDRAYSQVFTARNAVITVGSPLDSERIQKGFSKLLKNLEAVKKNDYKDVKQKTTFNNMGKTRQVELETSQSSVVFALPGILNNSEDRFAYRLANMVLGSGHAFMNRLMKEVRVKHGLCYSVGTGPSDQDLLSSLRGYAATSPENVEKLIEQVKSVIKEFVEKGITQDELDYYKFTYSSGNTISSTQSAVGFVSRCRDDNIPINDVNNSLSHYFDLKLEDVNRVIKKYFDYNKILFVVVGKTLKKGSAKKEEK